jgi:hypothetical protein
MQSVPITTNVVSSNHAQSRFSQYNSTLRDKVFQWYDWNIVENGVKHYKPDESSVAILHYVVANFVFSKFEWHK